jgi:hypothetical protein
MWIAYLAVSALALAYVAWAISKGKVSANGSSFYRAEEPKLFWFTTTIYMGAALAFGFLALRELPEFPL